MLDLDILLTVVGILLTLIGVGVLLLGKTRSDDDDGRRNIFEAFGIKLDVANPSVLLIMFGVLLMLAPRFVPMGQKPLDIIAGPTPEVLREAEQAPAVRPDASSAPTTVALDEAPSATAPVPATPPPAAPGLAATARPDPSPGADEQPTAEVLERDRQRQALLTERRAIAAEKARLAAERSKLASRIAPPAPAVTLPREPTASGSPPAPPLTRVVILAAAIPYEGESGGSLRTKLHKELRRAVVDMLPEGLAVDTPTLDFHEPLRRGQASALCNGTDADSLLLADLTAVEVESFGIESANWPNMRYWAVQCSTGRVSRTEPMRMEPTVGDRFPLQQSVARSARDFVAANRHLLQ